MNGMDFWKKLISGLLALMIGLTALPAIRAEDAFSGEELEGEEDAEGDNTEDVAVADPNAIYHEKTLADFTVDSPALYQGKITDVIGEYSIYTEKNIKSERVARGLKNTPVDVIYVGLVWVIVRYQGQLGYVKREYLTKNFLAYDPVHTAPFNVQKHQYIATVAKECYVRKTMTKEPLDEKKRKTYWVKLNPGTRISIWQFQDGWAIVNYMRSYGYIDPNDLKDLIPVSPTDQPISKESPIAAYTSYYTMKHLLPGASKETKTNNLNRIWNIGHGAEKITATGLLQPGDVFNGNKGNIGPYREYKLAIGLVDGKAVLSSGGGTCQVSSTLYNIICQMPGMTIIQRRPHGYGGASYLPIHCDAAVGNDALNFVFRNDYDYPIQLVSESTGDGALLMMAYRAD
ncbi:MAG: VanW family protein [Clostridiales bacterium]|nr:VanW family protein [Clostridiales bacterium]